MIIAFYFLSICFHSFRFFEYNYIPIEVTSRKYSSFRSQTILETNNSAVIISNNKTSKTEYRTNNISNHAATTITQTTLLPAMKLNNPNSLIHSIEKSDKSNKQPASLSHISLNNTPIYAIKAPTILACQKQLSKNVEQHKNIIYTTYYWLRVLLVHLLPCSSLVILNSLLIKAIRKAALNRARLLNNKNTYSMNKQKRENANGTEKEITNVEKIVVEEKKGRDKTDEKIQKQPVFMKLQQSKFNLFPKINKLSLFVTPKNPTQTPEAQEANKLLFTNTASSKPWRSFHETNVGNAIIEEESVVNQNKKIKVEKNKKFILSDSSNKTDQKKLTSKNIENILSKMSRRVSTGGERRRNKTSPTKMLVVVVSLFLLAEVPLTVLFILYIVSNTLEVSVLNIDHSLQLFRRINHKYITISMIFEKFYSNHFHIF